MGGSVYALTSPLGNTNVNPSEHGYVVHTVWNDVLCIWSVPTLGLRASKAFGTQHVRIHHKFKTR